MAASHEMVRAVRQALDNLEIGAAESSTIWTRGIKTELCKVGRDCFGCTVGALASEVVEDDRDHGEWLYDVTWLEYDGEYIVEACLVAELEWGGVADIDDDFQKLLLARAGVRLMIFDGTYEPGSEKIAERLARQAGEFRRSSGEDVWLLAAWERSDERDTGCRFRYFSIEGGAAREFGTA